MDPNENLREALELAKQGKPDCDRLSELVIALDEWISKGGFLPDRWEIARKRKREKDNYHHTGGTSFDLGDGIF